MLLACSRHDEFSSSSHPPAIRCITGTRIVQAEPLQHLHMCFRSALACSGSYYTEVLTSASQTLLGHVKSKAITLLLNLQMTANDKSASFKQVALF